MTNMSDLAEAHAKQANQWTGDQPVTVSAPIDAQVSTTYAVLALVEEMAALRRALCGHEDRMVGAAGRVGELVSVLEDARVSHG